MKYLQKSAYFLCAWCVIVLSSPAKVDAQEHRIAVLDIQGQGISLPEAETLTNYMRIEVAATGADANVGQSEISAVLSDMGLEEAGCTSPDCALEVGRLLAASHVVIGSVIKSKRTYDLDFQLFNIETQSVQFVVARTYRGDVDGLITSLQQIVWDLMELTPPPGGFQKEEQAPGPVIITSTSDPATVTFTSNDWNIPKTITFYGLNDYIADGDQSYSIVAGPVVSDDTIYTTIKPADVSVTNTDDDVAGITVEPVGGLQTSEAGGVDTFTVVLASEPTADVAIALSSSDTTEGTVSPSLLVFDAGNWNTLQTVTVSGVADKVDDGDQTYTIMVESAVSSDPKYSGLDPDHVPATNVHADVPGITVEPVGGLLTSEAGGGDIFTVVLTSEPTADVALVLKSSDTTEGTVSPSLLVFDAGNWSTLQTVTVSGVADTLDDGDQTYTIVVESAVSIDPDYAGSDPQDVSAINYDNQPRIIVYPSTALTTTEAGGETSFTILLTSQPSSKLSISLVGSDPTEGKISSSSLKFTRKDWNTPRTVTVTGVDDDLDDGDQAYTIVVESAVSNDSGYIGLDPDDISVTNIDDDEAGIIIEPVSELATAETGSQATFTVVLASEPVADVTLSFSSSDSTEASLWPQEPLVVDRRVRMKEWLAAHRTVVWAAVAAVSGGAAVWALGSVSEEPNPIRPPEFPDVPPVE